MAIEYLNGIIDTKKLTGPELAIIIEINKIQSMTGQYTYLKNQAKLLKESKEVETLKV